MHKRVIDGRFELVERLGGGGMGLVWRAWDVALHREVALKEVRPPDPSMDEHDPAGARELRARVLREARALARLNHPHVATIHHIVDPGEQAYPWIVMELVSGGSLQDRIQRGPMPPQEVARLGREVLSALRAAHAVGIQHRDVKPANVLLREDGRSVLTDFGIAAVRESTSLTATGSFIGSPEFMAPERINGVEGDPASDLWSLGMMLYVAVEGRHPLRRSTTLATLAAVLNQEVPPPERAGALAPVLQALLVREPAARPDAETLDRMLAAAGTPGSGPVPYTPAAPSSPPPAEVSGPMPPAYTGPPGMGGTGPGGHGGPPGTGHNGPGGPHGGFPSGPHGSGSTMPPGYGHPGSQPPPWGATPVPKAGTLHTRRSRRKGATMGAMAVSMSVAVIVVVGVLVWRFLPSLGTGGGPSFGERLEVSFSPKTSDRATDEATEDPAETGSDPEPATTNLLTPAGMRAMVAKIKAATGSNKIVRMTVYPEYAVFDAPLKNDKTLYDTFSFRDGQVTRTSQGAEIDTQLMDLGAFDWNVIPALLKRANKDLGVPKPTTRYMIVDPDFAFTTPKQVLRVYVSDDYRRTGYLVADPKGKVLKMYPND